jgi:cyanate permease
MNTGSALAAILSPAIAGYVIDVTGNWYLPFIMSIGVLAVGAVMSFAMHPEKQFTEEGMPAAKPRPAPAE